LHIIIAGLWLAQKGYKYVSYPLPVVCMGELVIK